MKLLLVFAMVIVIASTTELRLCGKKLTFVLGRLCNHRYNAPTKEQMESHNGHRHYTRHGIAHDCCTNRCSYQYLKTYCAPDNWSPSRKYTTYKYTSSLTRHRCNGACKNEFPHSNSFGVLSSYDHGYSVKCVFQLNRLHVDVVLYSERASSYSGFAFKTCILNNGSLLCFRQPPSVYISSLCMIASLFHTLA